MRRNFLPVGQGAFYLEIVSIVFRKFNFCRSAAVS